jgi:hypothetical protein
LGIVGQLSSGSRVLSGEICFANRRAFRVNVPLSTVRWRPLTGPLGNALQ